MDLSAVLWVAGMLVGLVAMIVCNKKQKTNPAMQPVAFVMFIIVLVCAGGLLNSMGIFGSNTSSLVSNEMAFAKSRGVAAGKFLAKVASGKKILYIAPPGYDQNESEQNTIAGLKEGFGNADAVVVDTITMPKDAPPVDAMMYEEYMSAKVMDEAISKHADAGIVVSAIGLPMDAVKMTNLKKVQFFMLNNGQLAGKAIAGLIKSGIVVGTIVTAPNAKYDVKAVSDPEETFKIRYVLVDKDNVDANSNGLGF